MIASVRARLALWHTAVLAILLTLFATSAYVFLSRTNRARTDATVADAASDLALQLALERRSLPTTRGAADEVLRELRFRTIGFVVYDRAGTVVAASIPRPPHPAPGEDIDPVFDPTSLGPIARSTAIGAVVLASTGDAEGGYRVALEGVKTPDGPFVVAAAQSVHANAETMGEARLAIAVAIPVFLLLAWVGGSLLARRSLRPMVAMREQASQISATSLDARVPIANPRDEVGQLAAVINQLLARLEDTFVRQRQFMADASHELRTPVAVVQHEASLALSRAHRKPEEYEEALTVVREAARRIRRIVDDLFLLARADAGELPVRRDPIYLNEIVADCVREVRSLADTRGVSVIVDRLPEAASRGDESLLHRLLVNLLDNAIKYSPAGARVSVRLVVAPASFQIEIEDTGPGISPDLQPRVFDRFVRGDAARSHDGDALTSGAGLGLSIARWIAEAHGGTLELARSSSAGTVFVLTLPA
jgi:heavy metal sensor kinase